MIIKNLNADYSGCGIGKLITLSTDTQTIISAYGKVLNLNQKGAVQTFFDSIAPFKSKFDILLLPILASTVQNGLYNAAKLLTPSAFSLGDLNISAKGVSVTPYSSTVSAGVSTSAGSQNYAVASPVAKNNDSHILAYIANEGRVLTNAAFGLGCGLSIVGSSVVSENTVFPTILVTGTVTGYGLNYVSFKCAAGVASIAIAKIGNILGSFSPVITTKADLVPTYTSIKPFSYGAAYLNWLQNSCSVFSTGSALTASELAIYEAAITSLVAAF